MDVIELLVVATDDDDDVANGLCDNINDNFVDTARTSRIMVSITGSSKVLYLENNSASCCCAVVTAGGVGCFGCCCWTCACGLAHAGGASIMNDTVFTFYLLLIYRFGFGMIYQ